MITLHCGVKQMKTGESMGVLHSFISNYATWRIFAETCTVTNHACECPIIPRIMPAKLILVTYNSQNYANTLGSGLQTSTSIWCYNGNIK